jgi:hypothetical protein
MRIAPVIVLALLAGCTHATEPPVQGDPAGSIDEPGRVRVVGAIAGFNHDDPRVRTSVQGRTVTVRVTTYGAGCHSQGPTEVTVDGLTADVRPYDYTAPDGTPCTMQLLSFEHEATIAFPRAGTAVIRVHGIDAGTRNAQDMMGRPIVVERRVELR